MAASSKQKQAGSFDANSVEHFAQLTREGLFNLASGEQTWPPRYRFLKDHGYQLRPRYSPKWTPSWTGTNKIPFRCEDAIVPLHYKVMDATRISDGSLVAIKACLRDRPELYIAQYLSSLDDHRNHCVKVYEILPDPSDPERALMVMPYLRPCNNPDFATIGDVVEFIDQTIEGLLFMHQHNVAHRDIATPNVMMDAKALYPNGHHPVRLNSSPDMQTPVSPLPRAGRNIRYLYIDFGLSSHFPPGTSSLVTGDVGRAYVPEITSDAPYDAYMVDIFALGDLYLKEIEQKFINVEFLPSLTVPMTQTQPGLRPSAAQVSEQWTKMRASFNDASLRWRLVPKDEQPLERVVNDTVAVAWEGVYRLKKFVAP
ncbi:kinase-like domain-containing protein [Lenzites betulinus]|nr:kinase-like domain-containing protein [Lenzites betulinus]